MKNKQHDWWKKKAPQHEFTEEEIDILNEMCDRIENGLYKEFEAQPTIEDVIAVEFFADRILNLKELRKEPKNETKDSD